MKKKITIEVDVLETKGSMELVEFEVSGHISSAYFVLDKGIVQAYQTERMYADESFEELSKDVKVVEEYIFRGDSKKLTKNFLVRNNLLIPEAGIMLSKMKALADHIGLPHSEVGWSEASYPDEFTADLSNEFPTEYEVKTKAEAIQGAESYAEISNQPEPFITDEQIEYWSKMGDGTFYYREL